MYTKEVVRLRSFALVLALLLAVGPVIGVVCELDCDQPPAKSSPCHNAAAREGATMRATTHACGHAHVAGPRALLTGTNSRDQLVTSIAVMSLCVMRASLPEPGKGTVVALHGPPGLNSGSTASLATVLRI